MQNKHLQGRDRFPADRVVLFVHGATYPSETVFDIDLPGGSWMDYAAVKGWSTANRPLMPKPINDNPDADMASGNSREKLGRSGVAARHFYGPNLARRRIDQPTISGRSCANLGSYKPPFALCDRTFSPGRRCAFFLDAGEPMHLSIKA